MLHHNTHLGKCTSKVWDKFYTPFLNSTLACIDYNFAVESVEHDLFRDDKHTSATTTFKSEAIPRLASTNKKVSI
jgi:hypothetical protein